MTPTVSGLRQGGEEREIFAKAVIIASGGFQSNPEWRTRYLGPGWDLAKVRGTRFNSGEGIRMAVDIGASTAGNWSGCHAVGWDRNAPEFGDLAVGDQFQKHSYPFFIMVNADGERFVNELDDTKSTLAAVVAQAPSTYWAIFDDDDNENFYVSGSGWDDYQRIRKEILDNPELTTQAASLAELGRAIDQDPVKLEATVARFNAMIDSGVDEDFGRFGAEDELSPLASIDQPPFYAIQFFPMTRKSMGGVAVDGETRVIREDGSVIPGLYASGELTGFAGVNGSAGLEGTFLGPAILTGRVAGRTLVRDVGDNRELEAPIPGLLAQDFPSQEFSSLDVGTCNACHNLSEAVSEPRSGYGHFERVHSIVLDEQQNCGDCHAGLAPYSPLNHEIDSVAQTANCVHCHLVVE